MSIAIVNNRTDGTVCVISQDNYIRSIKRMRDKALYNYIKGKIRYRSFFTLTIAPEYYALFCLNASNIFREFMNRVKITLFNRYKHKLQYMSRLESGEKTGRWHYHLITDYKFSKDDQQYIFLTWQDVLINRTGGLGKYQSKKAFDYKDIIENSDSMVIAYIMKYMAKSNKTSEFAIANRVLPGRTRRFTTSRGFEKIPENIRIKRHFGRNGGKKVLKSYQVIFKNPIFGNNFIMDGGKTLYEYHNPEDFETIPEIKEWHQKMPCMILRQENELFIYRHDKQINKKKLHNFEKKYVRNNSKKLSLEKFSLELTRYRDKIQKGILSGYSKETQRRLEVRKRIMRRRKLRGKAISRRFAYARWWKSINLKEILLSPINWRIRIKSS